MKYTTENLPPSFGMRLLSVLVRLGEWAQRWHYAIDCRRRTEISIPKGTLVSLDCKCPGCPHAGIWTVDRYDPEANDYRLRREKPGGVFQSGNIQNVSYESDFATENVLTVVGGQTYHQLRPPALPTANATSNVVVP